jgi:8-amino-3,8-dideoxy-alpha-D-manno-octulosonate transaminase
METKVASDTLALHGGPQAFPQMEGRPQPKIGIAEFMSIAERFGFTTDALERIHGVISEEDLGIGPNLAKYATAYPPQTKGEAFEASARALFGVKYALGVSSGTAALHCAMVAAGVGPGTEVIVPAIGFYATAAMVVAAKGVPIFCDVDESLHMDPSKVEAQITPRTVALAPTHVMGSICDLASILAIARRHRLKVIEDCAQSPGGKYKGRLVGTWGDLGCFSISAYKIIGGGEGGLVITGDERLWERANQLSEAGGLWRPARFAPPRYEGELFNGTNYRMSELEAAVDVVQLGKLPQIVGRYHQVKLNILRQLKTYREIVPQKLNDPDGEIGYLLRFYPQTFDLGNRIVEALRAEGIACGMRGEQAQPDWHLYADMFPITLKTGAIGTDHPFDLPEYRERGGHVAYAKGDCPVADDLFLRNITIPLNQWYSPADCRNIADGINKVLSHYCTEDLRATPWLTLQQTGGGDDQL